MLKCMSFPRVVRFPTVLLLALLGAGCSGGEDPGDGSGGEGTAASGGTGGDATGTGGDASGTGGGSDGGAPGDSPVSGLPESGSAGQQRPSGELGGMTVLDWAGFDAALSYTFDDSLKSQIDNYDALTATGARMTFYVVCSNNGSSDTWSQAVIDGHEVGNHTSHHCQDDGTGCAWGSYDGSLEEELSKCTTHIMDTFGATGVYTTAAPYGASGYGAAAMDQFFINRGVNSGRIDPLDTQNPFSVPCHLASEGDDAQSFISVIDSAHSAGAWQLMLIHSLGDDGGYQPIEPGALLDSISYAQEGNEIWIDSVENVGAYWLGQLALSKASEQVAGDETLYEWTLPDHFPPARYVRVTITGGKLSQGGDELPWNEHGYYEVALDQLSLTLSPL